MNHPGRRGPRDPRGQPPMAAPPAPRGLIAPRPRRRCSGPRGARPVAGRHPNAGREGSIVPRPHDGPNEAREIGPAPLAGSSFRRRRRRLCGHAIPSTASTSASRRRGTGRRRRQSDYSTTLIAPPPAAAAPWMRDPGRRPAREPGRRGRTSGRLPRSASARYLPVPMQPRPR
jgi:hypothetical protein